MPARNLQTPIILKVPVAVVAKQDFLSSANFVL